MSAPPPGGGLLRLSASLERAALFPGETLRATVSLEATAAGAPAAPASAAVSPAQAAPVSIREVGSRRPF